MINVRHLSKRFGDNVVLDDINFDIEKGDVIAIIGPSGTGKSTLLRCLDLLEHPEQGSISFEDQEYELSKLDKKSTRSLTRRTAMVFQIFNLFERKTALQNPERHVNILAETHFGIAAGLGKNFPRKTHIKTSRMKFPRFFAAAPYAARTQNRRHGIIDRLLNVRKSRHRSIRPAVTVGVIVFKPRSNCLHIFIGDNTVAVEKNKIIFFRLFSTEIAR